MGFIPYIRQAVLAAADESGNQLPLDQQLVVFPGMELTLGIPCQALLIFDANFPDDMFALATTALAINPANPSAEQCAVHHRLDLIRSFEELYAALDQYDFLKSRYIVLPNVSEGGSSTLLRAGHSGHYRTMPCIGGYLDGEVGQLGEGNTNILLGRVSEYGRKSLGLFQTSDNRSRNFHDLGKATTWVKWAEPSAEALRQACLARESRIAQTQPVLPQVAILSISISNSSFLGPINLEFNNQYNDIIGGSGTGKSTLLEYLRWVLCDEPNINPELHDLPDFQVKRASLVAQTLTQLNANVKVNFIKNCVFHSVRRDSKDNSLMLKIGAGDYELCSESDVRNLLPIQAYSQKQLSNVGVRLDELKRFVLAPVKRQLDDLNQKIENLALEIRSTYTDVQEKRSLQKVLKNDERELRSLSEQVVSIKKQLTGISEEDKVVLSQYDDYQEEERVVQHYQHKLAAILESLTTIKGEIDTFDVSPTALGSLPNAEIAKSINEHMTSLGKALAGYVQKGIVEINQSVDENGPLGATIKELNAKHKEFKAAYQAALAKSSAHKAILEQLASLEERLKIIRQRSAANEAAIKATGMPETQFNKLRNKWCELHDQRTHLFETQCAYMTGLSNGQLRASVNIGANITRVEEGLKTAITGSGVRGNKLDALFAVIAQDASPVRKYQTVLDELELLAIRDIDDPASAKLPTVPNLTASGITGPELDKISHKLTPEAWLNLCTIPLDDNAVFQYRTRESDYIPFNVASAGQQATALLTVLLNQPGVPLVIDQPEDDLDNKVIPDVVKQIWKAKQTRQLIFSSHNANLVVNGDAELVVCCDYRVAGEQSSGQIKYEGAIDIETIRNEITSVMEGGPDAFRLRKQKYGF
jgi:type III restriction enzyme